MYIMYVDESGDPGSANGSSEYFILSGLIMHYKSWYGKLDLLKRMRKYFKKKYGLNINVEIHAKELFRVSSLKAYKKIRKAERVKILKEYAELIPKIFKDCWLINVCLHKKNFAPGTDFTLLAFKRLITFYDMFLSTAVNDEGIIISDEADERKLRTLLKKMRIYNPVQAQHSGKTDESRITKVIEDILHRNSADSYFVQTVDVIAYLLKHKEYPKSGIKKYNLDLLFNLLQPILFKSVSNKDPQGIVRQ
jgi:hypothetical protein